MMMTIGRSVLYAVLTQALSLLAVGSNFEVSVTEDMSPGTPIFNLKDRLNLTHQSLDGASLKLLGDPKYFTIDPLTGIVSAMSSLDRDRLCPRAVDCLLPVDVAVHSKTYYHPVKLTVRIRDVNDNAPRFAADRVPLELPEGTPVGALVPVPAADDPDSPANGIKGYRLQSQDTAPSFRLVSERNADGNFDLSLELVRPLDRETQDVHRMILVAHDGGTPSKSGSAAIQVSVLDENDNPPRFESHSYNVSVPENTLPGKDLIQVRAFDPDQGSNARISYRLSGKSLAPYGNLFSVNRSSGWITLTGSLDYETYQLIILEVLAENEGSAALHDAAFVTINVVDVNDNSPSIDVEPPDIKVAERSVNDTVLAVVFVSDPDSKDGGKVVCLLRNKDESPSRHFAVVPVYENQYKIVTAAEMDREVTASYELVLVCRDGGQPVLESRKTLHVVVEDVNDNSPQFTQSVYNISVMENNRPPEVLFRVSATDKDLGRNSSIRYQLISDKELEITIDEDSGEIKTAISFDRESIDAYEFLVEASDRGTSPLSSTAIIVLNVLDANEAPRFVKTRYAFNVSEDTAPQSIIGYLEAYDDDQPPRNRFVYRLQDPSTKHGEAFGLNPPGSGNLTVSRVLDRESKDVYQLVAIVEDPERPGLRDTAEITIVVEDANDNAPLIRFPTSGNDAVFVSKNVSIGKSVASVIAVDHDLGNNAELTFGLGKQVMIDGKEAFSIDPKTGNIVVNSDLQQLNRDSFDLLVTVKDDGLEPRSSQAVLRVEVRAHPWPNVPGGDSDVGGDSSRTLLSGTQYLLIGGTIVGVMSFIVIVVLFVVCCASGCRRPQKRALKTSKPTERTLIGSQILKVDDELSQTATEVQKEYGFNGLLLNDDAPPSPYVVLNRIVSDEPQSQQTTDSRLNFFGGYDTTCSLVASPHYHPQQMQDSCFNQHIRLPSADFGLSLSPQLGVHGMSPKMSPMTGVLSNHHHPHQGRLMSPDLRTPKAYDDLFFNGYRSRYESGRNGDVAGNPLPSSFDPSPYAVGNDAGGRFSAVNSMERPRRRVLMDHRGVSYGQPPGDQSAAAAARFYRHQIDSCSSVA